MTDQNTRITDNETSIKLINQKLDFITNEIREIKDLLQKGYISKVEAEHLFQDHEKRISKMENNLAKVLWIILAPIIAAIVSAALYINQFTR